MCSSTTAAAVELKGRVADLSSELSNLKERLAHLEAETRTTGEQRLVQRELRKELQMDLLALVAALPPATHAAPTTLNSFYESEVAAATRLDLLAQDRLERADERETPWT